MVKAMALAAGVAAVVAAVIGLSLARSPAGAQAQGGLAAPANVRAADGVNPGQVTILWDAVDGAAFYRIGWVALDDIDAVRADGRSWLDAFDFKDVENKGQTTQRLQGLLPDTRYAFVASSVERRFGSARNWSEWTYLTTAAADATSCPTGTGTVPSAPDGGTPTPTPAPGATPTVTPTPAAGGAANGDYDADDDGLIEIASLAQLDVIRHDLDGDGVSAHADHAAAFPNAMAEMGCLEGCSGYELTADLDFDTNGNGRSDAGDAYWYDGDGWLPIGDPEPEFRYNAVFDGGGHTISNLFIRWADADHIGLFRATGEDGDIRNVRLAGVRVSGKDWVGGLVGNNGGSISGSSVAGRVSGATGIGGLVGYNGGSISGSSAAVAVSGSGNSVGGLAGGSLGTIADSSASGVVTGESSHVGGLVGNGNYRGCGENGGISGSYATGSVTGESSYVGGLIGASCDTISGSYATGAVTGKGNNVGGLAGQSNGAISGSYATGVVTGWQYVGGLVGGNSSNITASYATGSVIGNSYVGGLVGRRISGNVTNSYWDTQTSGLSRSAGGGGKTTRELQSPTGATGIYANWNAEWWDFGTSRQYPALKYRGLDVAAQRQ